MKKTEMMKMKNIVGDVVLLILANTEALKDIGITLKTIYVKALGYDDYGIWVEFLNFKIPKLKTAKGKKPKRPLYQSVTGSLLIPWPLITSIVHFPGVEGFDFPSPFESHIGFDAEKEENIA
jgi:hypothetical protein